MWFAVNAADYDISFLPASVHTRQYREFTARAVTSVCTAVPSVSTTTVASGVGRGAIYGKEIKMTVQKKREALDRFCDRGSSCEECVLKSPVSRCGCGTHFLTKQDGEFTMSDEEIESAYAIAFPEGEGSVPTIKDSGERRVFETGAVRDIQEGKGRCDLLPLDVVSDCFRFGGFNEAANVFDYIYRFQQTGDVKFLLWAIDTAPIFNNSWSKMFLEVSKHFEEGAKKYGENNWQKGLPINCYIDSAVRHFLKHLHGDTDEPHDRAFVWNLMCGYWTVKYIENGGNNHDED